MLKKIISLSVFIATTMLVGCGNNNNNGNTSSVENVDQDVKTLYDYTVTDIDGNPYDLNQLKGKKVMIVNTASKCGLTPQYEDLQDVYNQYKNKNFVIIGFPANNFKEQEPGDNKDIKEFCSSKYQITFPMMSKVSVKGDDMAEIYKFLTQKSLNGKEDSEVKWNFQKYLINEKGELEKVFPPTTSPKNPAIISWITAK